MELIKVKLKKILALAERGVGGEKDNAKRLLETLLKKHGLTLDDLGTASEERIVDFVCRSKDDEALLLQCVARVKRISKLSFWHAKGSKKWGVELNPIDAAEVGEMYKYFRSLYRKELKRMKASLFTAFVAKHRLTNPEHDDGPGESISPEELERMIQMARAMEDSHYIGRNRMIEGGKP